MTRQTNRRQDAHIKIALGGLIVKAGLKNADRAFILGVLINAAKLEPGSPEFERFSKIGIDELGK